MCGYDNTIRTLFSMLKQANRADSHDDPYRQPWQLPVDASQSRGLYGHIRNAIIALAGEAIVHHWAETHEIDLTLANRH